MQDKQIEEWARLVKAEDEGSADTERLFCEMANFLRKRHQELPSNIYVSVKNAGHGPRIKIQRNKGERMQIDDSFSLTICDAPVVVGDTGSDLSAADIAYFKDFVVRNKATLLAYWNGTLDTSDLTSQLEF